MLIKAAIAVTVLLVVGVALLLWLGTRQMPGDIDRTVQPMPVPDDFEPSVRPTPSHHPIPRRDHDAIDDRAASDRLAAAFDRFANSAANDHC